MPSGRVHALVTKRVLGFSGTNVQHMLDRTVKIHGAKHRQDHEHSLAGVSIELLKSGKLTPQNLAAAQLHLMTDEAVTRFNRKLGLKADQGNLLMEMLLAPKKRRRA